MIDTAIQVAVLVQEIAGAIMIIGGDVAVGVVILIHVLGRLRGWRWIS